MKGTSLVIGGAGFLGSNLCEKLLERGDTVICVDDLSTGSMKNIKKFEKKENFLFIQWDIVEIGLKERIPKIDYIWHLGCPASPEKYQKDGYRTLLISLLGTINILEIAKENNCKMLFTSTSEIYGDPLEHPQKETYWGNVNTVGPRSCYDEGKRCAETLIYEFRKKHEELSDKLKIIRIFNTYGVNMDINDGRVVTNFIRCVLNNEPITIYGDGLQTRSFCYVDDLIEGFISFMDSNIVGPINLGNPEEFTMLELKKVIEDILNVKDYPTIYLELPKDDPKKRKPDITMAIKNLNWKPKVSLKEGLERTYNYFKESFEN